MPHYIGTICGTEFADTAEPLLPSSCSSSTALLARWGNVVATDAKPAVRRSAERYIRALEDHID